MSYKTEQRLLDMIPYRPISGTYPIRLDANESFLSIPQKAREEFVEAVGSMQFNRYPDAYATELCKAFGEYQNIPFNNIMAGNGSDEIINVLCEAFLNDNSKVVTLPPDFSMYAFYTELRRGKVVEYVKNDNYDVDVKEVLELIRRETADMIIFSNPCNPTSRIIPREEVLY
ncbi:MAG: aminotransferase class I/II-fold pyridoxal phosphate-dependent enzyme, partial [Clostridia bacterium]|nr:aminotransferase class I/II-fold pyridoxal phosphate-dependent enzyme [Clostridia bacterium]